jgi:hypothetical protein
MNTDGFGVPDGFKSREDFLNHQHREQQRLNKEQFERDLAETKSNNFGILMFVVIVAGVIIAGLMGADI